MLQQRILVVENNAQWRSILSMRLEAFGYLVDPVKNMAEAVQRCESKTYHLALVDLSLGPEPGTQEREDYSNRDGCKVVEMINAKDEGTRVVVLSGHPDPQVAADVLQYSKADHFQSKDPLLQIVTPGMPDPLQTLITEQIAKADLKFLDGFDTPIRCITRGKDADLWRHQAVEALKPTYMDKSLDEYLKKFLRALGPARRRKQAAALLDVRPKDKLVEGLFWSKALGTAVQAILGTPQATVEAAVQARYGSDRPENLYPVNEFLIFGSVFASAEPRSSFVEP
jgi:CheY-like chemotaxis protein